MLGTSCWGQKPCKKQLQATRLLTSLVSTQARVSDAQLRGEVACAKLQEKLDASGAALQVAAQDHKEAEKQKRAVDKKLVSLSLYQADYHWHQHVLIRR